MTSHYSFYSYNVVFSPLTCLRFGFPAQWADSSICPAQTHGPQAERQV